MMINAAIVGLGRWGRLLAESVQGTSKRIRFTAGVTRSPAKAQDFCSRHGIVLHGDYGAVLDDPGIDAVVLATPHSQHFEQVIAAAHAGKHVFCEKPFTLTRRDAETALGALDAAALKVAVGHNRRFAPNTIELKRMIDAGELGELLHIEGNFSADLAPQAGAWRSDRAESPAGGMTSLGIHVVDAFIHLFGPVRRVQAQSRRLALPFDVDDSTSVLLGFEDGRTGALGTVAATALLWAVRAFGTKGWAEMREQDRLEKSFTDGTRDVLEYPDYGYPAERTLAAELDAFAQDIGGGAPFPVSPTQILHGIAVLEAIIRSAEAGGAALSVAKPAKVGGIGVARTNSA